ncbi:MAG: CvpA family protein [Thermoflavifilum aggregans]|nr:CvpA family protein [Thermoflavifilum aggregans]
MWIDILFAVLVLTALYKGLTRGLVMALAAFAGWVIGLTAALKLTSLLAHKLQDSLGWAHAAWLPVAVFVLLFLIVALLVHLWGKLLERALQLAALGWLNRLMGFLLYLLLYLIIFSVVLWLANQLYLITPTTKAHSAVYHWIAPIGPFVIDEIGKWIPVFSHIFQDLQHFFEQVGRQLQHA